MEANRRRFLARPEPRRVGGDVGRRLLRRCAGLHLGRGGLARLGDKGVEGEIKRDVRRTFASRAFFAPDHPAGGRDLLADVLLALANACPETSCRGMNLVCGALLEVHVRQGVLDDDGAAVAANGIVKRRRSARSSGSSARSRRARTRRSSPAGARIMAVWPAGGSPGTTGWN